MKNSDFTVKRDSLVSPMAMGKGYLPPTGQKEKESKMIIYEVQKRLLGGDQNITPHWKHF